MTPAEVTTILRHLDGWPVQSHSCKKVRKAIDAAVEMIECLEAAEKERDWHAERCEDAMNECDVMRTEIEELHVLIAAVKKQADAEFCLRVKKRKSTRGCAPRSQRWSDKSRLLSGLMVHLINTSI